MSTDGSSRIGPGLAHAFLSWWRESGRLRSAPDTLAHAPRALQESAPLVSNIAADATTPAGRAATIKQAVAARGGEQGRGFAVMAGEVRTLAQRSSTAAKEIKDLIGESVGHVDEGSRLVEEAGGTINDIVRSGRRVADIIGEISSASEEQRTGIEQVNHAVVQLNHVTQRNAALVEEASAAAQLMAGQPK